MIRFAIWKSILGLAACYAMLCANHAVYAQEFTLSLSSSTGSASVYDTEYGGSDQPITVTTGQQLTLTVYISGYGAQGYGGVLSCDGGSGYYDSGQGVGAYNQATWYWTPTTQGTYYLSCSFGGGPGNINRYTANIIVTVAPPESSTYDPAYQVTSIIYAPPGNKSQDGFTDNTTNGTTTTVGSSFQYGSTMTFSYGWGFGSAGASFGVTASTSDSTAFQETFTDGSGIANASQTTNPNVINHNQDLFLIWLNPEVTVLSDGSTPESYSVGIQPTANGETPAPDVLEITANVMEANSAGVTTVPAVWLNQQYNAATGQYTPGLAAICRNQTYYPNNCSGDPNGQCGCTPADFAPILAMDPLLSYSSTQSPLLANASNNCGTLPIPSGSNCRYVPVPDQPGSTVQEVETLAGPDYPGDNNSPNTFTQTENTQTTQTYGESSGESVSVSLKAGVAISLTTTDTWTWTNSQSTGTANGSGSTLSVTLNSATVGCGQDIPVYEDTVFHTFVFQQPAGNNSCP